MAKGMTIAEAKAECERWFAYNKRQVDKSKKKKKIAAAVRAGEIDQVEAKRRVRSLDNCSVTVFDGANLERAVKVLLMHVKD